MALVDIKNLDGRTVGQVDLADDVFGRRVNPHLLHEVTRWYLRSQRAGTHKTKGRGEVSGAGRKLWRQKGTGRARVGSIRSSIWRKGGTVHGPQPRSYAYALPKKMVLGALRSALSAKLAEQKLTVVEGWPLETHKTGKFRQTLARLDGDTQTILGGGAGRQPQSGTGQPQSRRRQAGYARDAAGLRSVAARPADAVEGHGACSLGKTLAQPARIRGASAHGGAVVAASSLLRQPAKPKAAKAKAAAKPKAPKRRSKVLQAQAQGQGQGIREATMKSSIYSVIRRPIVTEKGLGVKETAADGGV